jgi:hypothetical protein
MRVVRSETDRMVSLVRVFSIGFSELRKEPIVELPGSKTIFGSCLQEKFGPKVGKFP